MQHNNWDATLADRDAGLIPGFIGHDETLEAFADRTEREEADARGEIVRVQTAPMFGYVDPEALERERARIERIERGDSLPGWEG